ncbi:MAG: pantetheine-phosphate adenylyltransferase [Blastocatellia bacterium]|jgi:pantetheine-phosphate adenylyltransferase
MRKAIFPGTFDPLTNGHLDLIRRATRLFDEVIVAILVNPGKAPLFSIEERMALLEEVLSPEFSPEFAGVRVDCFSGLLVEYARRQGAQTILRGIRSSQDYEYEWPMIWMNRRLDPELETLLLVASEETSGISSSLLKEVFRLGGSIDGLVPDPVLKRMKERA